MLTCVWESPTCYCLLCRMYLVWCCFTIRCEADNINCTKVNRLKCTSGTDKLLLLFYRLWCDCSPYSGQKASVGSNYEGFIVIGSSCEVRLHLAESGTNWVVGWKGVNVSSLLYRIREFLEAELEEVEVSWVEAAGCPLNGDAYFPGAYFIAFILPCFTFLCVADQVHCRIN